MAQSLSYPTIAKQWDEFPDENPPLPYVSPDELARCLPDVFVTSDNHWFHRNIIRFQDRPWNVDDLMALERDGGRACDGPALWRRRSSLHA